MSMIFDTKIAVVLCDDLAMWQKLNVTAFLTSGVVGQHTGIIGEPYLDGSGNSYAPMLIQPVMIYQATSDEIRKAHRRALENDIRLAIFTEDLFTTSNDVDNRGAVLAKKVDELHLVGFAVRDTKKIVDKIIKGLKFHP